MDSTPDLLHVLVVDDVEINRTIAKALLTKLGHAVVVAGSGQDALYLFGQQRFDLVLMDVQMPIIDGLETTRIIRALEERQPVRRDMPMELIANLAARLRGGHLPILALSANVLNGEVDRYAAVTADQVKAAVAKYFTPQRRSTVWVMPPAAPPAPATPATSAAPAGSTNPSFAPAVEVSR